MSMFHDCWVLTVLDNTLFQKTSQTYSDNYDLDSVNNDLDSVNNDLDDDNSYLDNDLDNDVQDLPVLRETEEGAIVQLCPGPVLHPAGTGVHTGLLLWRQHSLWWLLNTAHKLSILLASIKNSLCQEQVLMILTYIEVSCKSFFCIFYNNILRLYSV